jgi:hypothetical protein
MRASAIVAALLLFAGGAMAQPATSSGSAAGATCKTQAAGKNLHGAALTSTVKSCCKQQAAAQKLHGAAETSFRNSCEKAGLAP